MNLQQFAALKVGDKIENAFTGGVGTVTEVTEGGVRVRWGLVDGSSGVTYFFSVNSTAWMHWSKADDNAG